MSPRLPFCRSAYGEVVAICGNCIDFGNWDLVAAKRLDWNEGHVWTCTVGFEDGEA